VWFTIYSSQNPDTDATVSIEDSGATIHLSGNTWDQIDYAYTVTSNTVIEFDSKSTVEGEIQGIGFDTNSSLSSDLTLKLFGTQSWGISDTNTYDSDGEWVHYTINVGSYYTGDFTTLFFVNDDDANSAAESYFSNIKIYEDEPMALSGLITLETSDISSYGGATRDITPTNYEVQDDGATLGRL
jgi:hypothetical protein